MGANGMNVKQDIATKILIVDDNELISLMLSRVPFAAIASPIR
jgi:hypothetical protein